MEKKEDQLSHLLLENNSLLQDLQEKIYEDNLPVPAPTLGSSSGVAAAWLAQEARNTRVSQPATVRKSSKASDRSLSHSLSSAAGDAWAASQEADQTVEPGNHSDSLTLSRTRTDPTSSMEEVDVPRPASAAGFASWKAADLQVDKEEEQVDKRKEESLQDGEWCARSRWCSPPGKGDDIYVLRVPNCRHLRLASIRACKFLAGARLVPDPLAASLQTVLGPESVHQVFQSRWLCLLVLQHGQASSLP